MPARYATVTDLARTASGGWEEVAQRAAVDAASAHLVDGELMLATAEGKDRAQWAAIAQAAADAALVRALSAIDSASRHIDTHLFPRYRAALPLSPSFVAASNLPAICAAIALKRLYGASLPEELRRGVQWAEDYLIQLAKGTVSLGELDTAVAQAPGRMSVRAPSVTFEWDRY